MLLSLDINECVEAAMSSRQLCNQTQVCVNRPGSFVCQCPPGTELNTQGTCQVPTPPPSTTTALPTTIAPPTITTTITTTSTMATSTSQPVVLTTSPLFSVTPSVPAGADRNEVIVTLDGLTVALVRHHSNISQKSNQMLFF